MHERQRRKLEYYGRMPLVTGCRGLDFWTKFLKRAFKIDFFHKFLLLPLCKVCIKLSMDKVEVNHERIFSEAGAASFC
jgi:hypothetical protein